MHAGGEQDEDGGGGHGNERAERHSGEPHRLDERDAEREVDDRRDRHRVRHQTVAARAFEHRVGRRDADAHDDGQRQQLQHDHRAAELRAHPRVDERRRHQHQRAADGDHRRERQLRALQQDRLEPIQAARRVVVDHGGEQHVVELIGEALGRFREALAHGPHGHRRGVHEGADHERVHRVVQLLRPVDQQHVDAEARHFPKPCEAEPARREMQPGEHAIRVGAVDPIRQHANRRRRDDELDQPVAEREHHDVDERRDDAAHRADDVVQVIALEAVDDAAVYTEDGAAGDVQARDEQHDAPEIHLVGGELEEPVDVDRQHDRDEIRDRAERCEDRVRRAEDLVEGAQIPPRAILRDELHERARIAHVENREVGRHRRREHPQAVGGLAEMRHVEGQHHEADDHLDQDRDVPGGDIARDGQRLFRRRRAEQRQLFGRWGHLAPFPERITFTVSITIVRSKTIDRCLM